MGTNGIETVIDPECEVLRYGYTRLAEMAVIGGILALYCPDEKDGPYTIVGEYYGGGCVVKHHGTHTNYVVALRAMLAMVVQDRRNNGCE